MIHVVLYEPEIPPNTGNIARTCAATGVSLHLVEPLGFSVAERDVRRAGLDYWDLVDLHVHRDWRAFLDHCGVETGGVEKSEIAWAFLSTRGTKLYTSIEPRPDTGEVRDLYLVFGPETRGLPTELLAAHRDHMYRVPMSTTFRSLNLANTVALVLYDVLRRQGFPGLV